MHFWDYTDVQREDPPGLFSFPNIFLDNKLKYDYIQTQLKKAIAMAKKSGYAVAIGHPHKITLKVLNESKHLLKDLNMVYVNKIPKI